MNALYAVDCGPRLGLRRRTWRWAQDEDVAYMPVPVDVREDEEAFVIRAAMPGLKAEEVNIHIEDDTITLRGERRGEEPEEAKFLLRERYTGKLGRTLRLDMPLDAEGSEATLQEGVLTLRVPKAASARSKSIPVNVK